MENETIVFCNGTHKCILCNNVFKCGGVGYGHDNSKEGNCHGDYEQFCNDHKIEEYIKYHKEHGEL